MSQNPNAPNGDQEQGRLIVVGLLILILIIFAYYTIQEEISAFAGAMAYIHVYPFAKLVSFFPELRSVPFIGPQFFAKVELAKLFLDQGNFAYMTTGQTREVLSAAGLCSMPVYLTFMLYAGIKGKNFRPDVVFKTAYDLDRMIWVQSEHWLTSRNARHINPLKLSEVSAGMLAKRITEKIQSRTSKHQSAGHLIQLVPEEVVPAPWHRALRPEEWLVGMGLCLDQRHIDAAISKNWKYPDGLLESRDKWHDLKLETLMEALAGQLRTPWSGFKTLRPSHKAIAAVMCLFYDYDITGGNILLNDLGGINDSIKAKAGAMDAALLAEDGFMSRLDKILMGTPGNQMLEIANNHAWLESAFPAMLTYARKNRGVLPAAAFLWIKGEDRKLWYILDNVGSEAVMIESAGAMAHFRAENQIGKPIRRPAVYQAARALLEDYLDMTPDRIVARREKAERARTAGDKINIMFKDEDKEDVSKRDFLKKKGD